MMAEEGVDWCRLEEPSMADVEEDRGVYQIRKLNKMQNVKKMLHKDDQHV